MGFDKSNCVKFNIGFSDNCKKSYKKILKKSDQKLIQLINERLNDLGTNPKLGKRLVGKKKAYSIRINKFDYRIIYYICYSNCTIIVDFMDNRKNVYDKASRNLMKYHQHT